MRQLLVLSILTAAAISQSSIAAGADTNASRVSHDAFSYPTRYQPARSEPTLIVNTTILDGAGRRFEDGFLLIERGNISAIGTGSPPHVPEAHVIDGTGKWITPGIVENHAHLGIAAAPRIAAHRDLSEMSGPNAAQVWAEHSVWPQDPALGLALAGGVTTLHVLPGSSTLFSGRTVTLKNVPARTVSDMKFPNAPPGIKMACGENPKAAFGDIRGRPPFTRMGIQAIYRQEFYRAQEYLANRQLANMRSASLGVPSNTPRNLALDTLAGVLTGEILVHVHCYRADDMANLLALAEEFDFRIAAFHHASESYKIADMLAEHGVCASLWADHWGWKMEALDDVPHHMALLHRAGGCVVAHADLNDDIQRLTHETAKGVAAGRRIGIEIPPEIAIQWNTSNPARSIGVDHMTGSLEPGKMADVLIWNGNPFSVYSLVERVYVDGVLLFDRFDPTLRPVYDFEIGRTPAGKR